MTKLMLKRVRIIFVLVIAVFILLSGRLAYLQILQHDYYWNRGERNRLTKITLVAARGEIYDRQGELLVSNRPGFVVSLMDMGEGYDQETIAFLSETLEIEEQEIYDAIKGQLYMRYLPLRLKSDITDEIIARISENRWKLKGVNIEVHPIRDYRVNDTAAHVLGYLGQGSVLPATQERWAKAVDGYTYKDGDLVGQVGIEHTWEPWLRGQDGEQLIETNHLGQAIDYFDRKEPVPGYNLYLTLDLDLQKVAEEALERRVEMIKTDGKGNRLAGKATAVVMDPNTGAILALANYPSYDLNTFRQDYDRLLVDPQKPLFNTAIQGSYPGGSTYKMVAGAAVLEEGLYNERNITYCPGVITLVGATRSCYNNTAHGAVNFYDAMAVSCNIYFYRAGLAAGIDRLSQYGREFGFGSPTGLTDLPGESSGILFSREYKTDVIKEMWYPADTMSVAIGQLSTFTALQLVNYVSIIANGGTHYRPYLVQSVVDSQGRVVNDTEPDALRQTQVSERTLAVLREGMRRVTQPRGTAWYHFSSLPVSVAAKTGSAQVAAVGSGIPPHSLFVGFAPFNKPEIAVAVIVEHGGLGATGAVPIAAEIMEYYFTGTIKGVMDSDVDDGPPAD